MASPWDSFGAHYCCFFLFSCFNKFFQVFFKDIVGPVFYASALLIFISAIARLADDFGKGTAAKPAENAVGDSKGLNLE